LPKGSIALRGHPARHYWQVLNPEIAVEGWHIMPVAHSASVEQSCAAPAVGHDARHDDPVSAEVVSNSAQQMDPGAQFVESP
jgi:hypothetical protein